MLWQSGKYKLLLRRIDAITRDHIGYLSVHITDYNATEPTDCSIPERAGGVLPTAVDPSTTG